MYVHVLPVHVQYDLTHMDRCISIYVCLYCIIHVYDMHNCVYVHMFHVHMHTYVNACMCTYACTYFNECM